jgi:hypothetical protein
VFKEELMPIFFELLYTIEREGTQTHSMNPEYTPITKSRQKDKNNNKTNRKL